MRRTSNYLLREIAGILYLIPYGQPIADHRRGMRLNCTGAWLWQQLEKERTYEELLALFASHYEASLEELPFLEQDLSRFLYTLKSYGMLETPVPIPQTQPEKCMEKPSEITDGTTKTADNATETAGNTTGTADSNAKIGNGTPDIMEVTPEIPIRPLPDTPGFLLCIGGLYVKIIGPQEAIPEPFHTFGATAGSIRQTIILHQASAFPLMPAFPPAPAYPPAPASPLALFPQYQEEKVLLRSGDLTVYDEDDDYLLLFPSMEQVRYARLSKDASRADLYCTTLLTETVREELFHAIRFLFLYLAEKHPMEALHSASLLYRGRAWLFSGSSGTGKSTHTNLWHTLLHAPLLNGDLNLLALENGCPVIHGLPWCGTSGISCSGTHPLGGIILLKQDKEDFMEELSPDARQLSVLQRIISPLWTPEQLDRCLHFTSDLTRRIYVAKLHCTKNTSAVETAKKAIDTYLYRT